MGAKHQSDSDSVEDPDLSSEEEETKVDFNFNRSTIKAMNDQDIISQVVGSMKTERVAKTAKSFESLKKFKTAVSGHDTAYKLND